MKTSRLPMAVSTALVLLLFASAASATLIGNLNITSGAGGVTVSATNIDWFPPVGAPDGPFVVGGGTTMTYGPGNTLVAAGNTGRILDLTLGVTVLPLAGFMTFDSLPISLDLTNIGPGPASTNCAGLAVGDSCSPYAGSPFYLTLVRDFLGNLSTAVVLPVGGTATDNTPGVSVWRGAFTTQLTGVTPVQVQSTIGTPTNPGGSITSSHSGSFTVDFVGVPEPATMMLMGSGLALVGLLRRRRS